MQLSGGLQSSSPRSIPVTEALRIVIHRIRSSVLFMVAFLFLVVGSVLTASITPASLRNPQPGSVLFGLFPLLLLGVGALLLRSGSREVFLPLRLYRSGAPARGVVTGLQVVARETFMGRHPLRVRYAFRDRFNQEHTGSLKTLDAALLDTVAVGAQVTVLYDPRQPRRSTLLAGLGCRETNPREMPEMKPRREGYQHQEEQ